MPDPILSAVQADAQRVAAGATQGLADVQAHAQLVAGHASAAISGELAKVADDIKAHILAGLLIAMAFGAACAVGAVLLVPHLGR